MISTDKRVKLILIVIVPFFFVQAQQKSPEKIVEQYNNAYFNNDWERVAELTNPDELSLFKRSLKNDYYKIAASDVGVENIDSLCNLSHIKLYAFFLKYLYTKIPALNDAPQKKLIGTVYENKKYAYVVYRSESNYIDVIELKNSKNEWKINFLDPYVKITFM